MSRPAEGSDGRVAEFFELKIESTGGPKIGFRRPPPLDSFGKRLSSGWVARAGRPPAHHAQSHARAGRPAHPDHGKISIHPHGGRGLAPKSFAQGDRAVGMLLGLHWSSQARQPQIEPRATSAPRDGSAPRIRGKKKHSIRFFRSGCFFCETLRFTLDQSAAPAPPGHQARAPARFGQPKYGAPVCIVAAGAKEARRSGPAARKTADRRPKGWTRRPARCRVEFVMPELKRFRHDSKKLLHGPGGGTMRPGQIALPAPPAFLTCHRSSTPSGARARPRPQHDAELARARASLRGPP